MIKYLVEVLVALPDQTWMTVEQVIEQADDGDFKACERAQKRVEREMKQRRITYVLTAILAYEILEGETE